MLPMWKSLQMSLKACLLLAAKVWNFVAFLFKKQYRTIQQHKAIQYDISPLSPIDRKSVV